MPEQRNESSAATASAATESVRTQARKRVLELTDIAKAEEHGWSIPEVLRRDAGMILALMQRIEELEADLAELRRSA